MEPKIRNYAITVVLGLQLLTMLAPWVSSNSRRYQDASGYEMSDGIFGVISIGVAFALWMSFVLGSKSLSRTSYGFLTLWWGGNAVYFTVQLNKNANNSAINIEWGYVAYAILLGLLMFLTLEGFWTSIRSSVSLRATNRKTKQKYDLQPNELYLLSPLPIEVVPSSEREQNIVRYPDAMSQQDLPNGGSAITEHIRNGQRW